MPPSPLDWLEQLPWPTVLWWGLSGGLIALALLTMLINWGVLAENLSGDRRGPGARSCVHFIGGIAGTLGLLICPIEGLRSWAWLAIVLDPTFAMELSRVRKRR